MLAAGCRRLQAGVWRPYLRPRRHRWTQFNGGFYTSRPLCLERQNLFATTSVHYYSALSLSPHRGPDFQNKLQTNYKLAYDQRVNWGRIPRDLRSGTCYLRSTTSNNRSCTSHSRPGTFLLGSTTLLMGRIQASNTI